MSNIRKITAVGSHYKFKAYHLKKILLSLIVVFAAALGAKAQIGYNYSQYDFGVGSSYTKTKTDFAKSTGRYSFNANFTYNQTPFVNFIAELQVGSMNGYDLSKVVGDDSFASVGFNNNYTSVAFRAQLQMGEILDYSHSQFKNFFKNLYISSGVGVVYSNYKPFPSDDDTELKGSDIFIPIRLGYELKFFNAYSEPTVKLDLGYQYNYVFSDNFDGVSFGKGSDSFTQFVVGLKFALGGSTSYKKQIDY